jgi:hypothetical protein
MRPRFAIGRSTLSNHITQLRMGKLIRRVGTKLTVAHPHQLQRLLIEVVRYQEVANADSMRTIAAELAELQDSPLNDWHPADATSTQAPGSSSTFGHEGFIQRDATLNAHTPPIGASQDLTWVWLAPATTGPKPLALSQPAQYIPPTRMVLMNAHWMPFMLIVQAYAPEPQDYPKVFIRLQMIVELEIAQILSAITPKRAIAADSGAADALNEALHDHLRKRLPHVEEQLRDALTLVQ